jgi:hypothetical protein
LPSQASAHQFAAKVVALADADALTVTHGGAAVRVRLHGVDDAGKETPWRRARLFTAELLSQFGRR